MTNSSFRSLGAASTPQTEPLDERQVANSAGGFVYELDRWDQLDRFLVLGTEGGTYYANERDLTRANVDHIRALIAEDGPRVITRLVEFRESRRAPKTDPLILVLALCASADAPVTRKMALNSLASICRYSTELFNFCAFVEQFRGWGHGLARAVARWYEQMTPGQLAYQAIKYRQRNGWTHRDVLRLSHPRWGNSAGHRLVYEWICRGQAPEGDSDEAKLIRAHMAAMGNSPIEVTAKDVRSLVIDHRLPWEAIDNTYLKDPLVWDALISSLPPTALIRNLATMTRVGYTDLPGAMEELVRRIGAVAPVNHPFANLLALVTYQAGKSFKGTSTWEPRREIVDALDAAFYESFGRVEPTGKRIINALDVSASMTWDSSRIHDSFLTAREASAAMAMATVRSEQQYRTVAFTGGGYNAPTDQLITEMNISPRQRLDDVIRTIQGMRAGGTDCALPMLWAMENGIEADAFVIYTDDETHSGRVHPVQALRQYRTKTGINAKLVVVGMTSTGFTIADPKDRGMLDVVGFDGAAPGLIADFIRD